MTVDPLLTIAAFINLAIMIGIPLVGIVLLVYFYRQRRREKRAEAEKDYSKY